MDAMLSEVDGETTLDITVLDFRILWADQTEITLNRALMRLVGRGKGEPSRNASAFGSFSSIC
jgi:hypothetical protein